MTELATTEDTLRSNKTLTWVIYGLWVIYRLVIGGPRLSENPPIVEGKFGLAA